MGFFRSNNNEPEKLTKAQTLDHLIQDKILRGRRENKVSYRIEEFYNDPNDPDLLTGLRIIVQGHRDIPEHMFSGDEVKWIIELAAAIEFGADFDVWSNETYTFISLRPIKRRKDRKEYPFSQNINRSLGLPDAYRDTKQDQPKNPDEKRGRKKKDNDND